MKIYFLVAAAFLCLASCKNQDNKKAETNTKAASDTTKFTAIQWIDSVKDVGVIDPEKVAEITFKFKNIGENPLYIVSAQPGCGCTVADYPKEPIAPGEEGVLKANFDPKKGTGGSFRKSISVTTNTKPSENNYIFFYGNTRKESDSTTTASSKVAGSKE